MYELFTLKQWESSFFERDIFELTLKSSMKDIKAWPSNALVTIKVNAVDYSTLNIINTHGFEFCEGELQFHKTVPMSIVTAKEINYELFLADESSINELTLMVSDFYINSRFRTPWFTPFERDKFYQEWIKNSVLSSFDDCCMIIKNETLISGFVTVRIVGDEAKIGLIGVRDSSRGQGVAGKLLQLVDEYCVKNGVTKVTVATQASNISAVRLYCKSGFHISNSSYWFYKKV